MDAERNDSNDTPVKPEPPPIDMRPDGCGPVVLLLLITIATIAILMSA